MLVGFLGLGLISYVLSQMFMPVEAHPAHWLAALIGAILGGVLGWLWYNYTPRSGRITRTWRR